MDAKCMPSYSPDKSDSTFTVFLSEGVCLVAHVSAYDTAVIGGPNSDGSYSHGLFQINDTYWCRSPGRKSEDECEMPCSGELLVINLD